MRFVDLESQSEDLLIKVNQVKHVAQEMGQLARHQVRQVRPFDDDMDATDATKAANRVARLARSAVQNSSQKTKLVLLVCALFILAAILRKLNLI